MSFSCKSCMQKCRIIVYIYAIAWYMQLYLIHIGFIWYICVLCILWIHCYTLDICTYVRHTIPSVSSIECCVLLVVTCDLRQRSPAAALHQQQKLCGCPCFQRTKYWLHAKGFPLTTTVVRPQQHKATTTTSATLTSSSTTARVLFF